ncbi:MAG: choline dehydrogenase-like flavoprotein [Chlamydiales bacterium]|jgi:choline dehydrogenase-like flavoprotein
MSIEFDVCVIGSGAGGGPIAWTLAKEGYKVLVLEKGPWFKEGDFFKDEIGACKRDIYTPDLKDEQHVIEKKNRQGSWSSKATSSSGRSFWNGNCVGGSSNFMSGFFYRMKPNDFRLLSEFGPIEGANTVDWPITYEDLEPYYTKVESLVGVSGVVTPHPHQEPRSTEDFPYPPTLEHPLSGWLDKVCRDEGLHPLVTPRAILSEGAMGRGSCGYSGYCGSYGCTTKAKGSSRAALLDPAVRTGNCEVRPHSKVYHLLSDESGNISAARYYDRDGKSREARAKLFVVACQAIETSRLLLSSTGPRHKNGLGNRYGQVGKNLVFSAGGVGRGDLLYKNFDRQKVEMLKVQGPFVNRGLQDWYEIKGGPFASRTKGGTIDFLFAHPNPIRRAQNLKWDDNGGLLWGKKLKDRLKEQFTGMKQLKFETFCDWLPTDNCFVSLDPSVKDKWGTPVARVRTGYHPHDLKVGAYLSERSKVLLKKMGAENIQASVSGSPPPNLVVGGCRFGTDPQQSVLDVHCKLHDSDNLFVTDGSFMPTGGSITYTWTIYANAFRVADHLLTRL